MLCLGLAACTHKEVHTVPPVPSPPVAPVENKPAATAPAPPKVDTQPQSATLPPSEPVNLPRPKPRHTNGEHSSDTDQPAHPTAPQISPQMSPGDQASMERHTNEDVAAAQANLAQTANKRLSAPQQDLVDKIRSFLDQSADASKSGDWARAQNLAQKARLLSVELVNSL